MPQSERVEQIVDLVQQMDDKEQEKILLVMQGAMLMKEQKEQISEKKCKD